MHPSSDPAFLLGLIDLTSLQDADTDTSIRQLASDAVTPLGVSSFSVQ